MPDPETKDDASKNTLLRWILGVVLAGCSAVGGWGASEIRESNTRASKAAEDSADYLKDLVKTEREELRTERSNGTEAIRQLSKSIDGQTVANSKVIDRLDTLITDQKRGVWRDAEPAPKQQPRPE